MKKTICVLLLAAGLFAVPASAQNWADALKGAVSSAIDNATGGKPTEAAIRGTWNYAAPGVKMSSDDALANMGGSVIESTVAGKLTTAYEKVGIRPGFCSITFNDDKSFSMPIKGHEVTGTYEYDASTHAVTLHVGRLGTAFTGYAYISGTDLQLVFPVDKLVSFVTAIGSKVSSLSGAVSLLEKYDSVYIGFEFSK